MKQLIDFIPLVIFFVLFKTYDIYVATGALIVATGVQVAYSWFKFRKVEKMQLITFVMVTIFGGLTIFMHNENFIKWKVTMVYALFALFLLGSQLLGKPAVKSMLGKELTLPDTIWNRINFAWVLFFSICALVNIYIAFNMPLEVWVNFKVFGLLILTILFTLATGVYIYKQMPEELQEKETEEEK